MFGSSAPLADDPAGTWDELPADPAALEGVSDEADEEPEITEKHGRVSFSRTEWTAMILVAVLLVGFVGLLLSRLLG